MNRPEPIGAVIQRWIARRDEWTRLGAIVSGGPLAEEVIRDLEAVTEASDEELNLTQAAELTGYSADHLGKLVRKGTLTNYGKKGSPRVRRSELPHRTKSTLPRTYGIAYDARTDAKLSLGSRR